MSNPSIGPAFDPAFTPPELGALKRLKPVIDLMLLVLTVGVVGSQSLMLSPLVPDLAAGLKVGGGEIGIALGVYGGATGLSALLLGPRLDPFARRHVLSLALILLAVALLLGSLSAHWLAFAAAQGLGGIAAGILLPISYATAGDMAPKGHESAFIGKVLMGWSLAMIGGVPLGGWLGDLFGWRGALMVMAGLALIVALGTSQLTRNRAGLPPRPVRRFGLAELRSVLAIPAVPSLLLICFSIMLAFYAAYGFLGAYARLLHGGSAGDVGVLALGYGAGFAITGMLSGFIDRLGAIRASALSSLLLTGIYLGLGPAAQAGIMPLACLMLGFGMVNHIAINAVVSALSAADPARRGTILSLNSAVTYAGFMAGSMAGGLIFEGIGYPAVTLISAGALAAAWVIALRLGRRKRRH